jgi:thioester reductase-like protein
VLAGDLALPQLGLCWEDFRQLAEQTDAIYHAGAWVNFTFPYSVLKTANVFGTQEILRLASLGALKPVHFISTTAVFTSPGYDPTHTILEDDPLNYCAELHTGYAESKWVAEKLVMEARNRGIPVSIYRPATVTGHSQTGVFNTNDFVLRMLKSCIELKQVPEINLRMYITPVDYVSKAIVLLSLQPHLLGKAFNLIPSQPTDVQTLAGIARSFGYPMQAVSFADWHASLQNMAQGSQETNVTPFLPLLQQQRTVPTPMLDCSNTLMGLKNTSLAFPPIDRELFRVYFDSFSRSSFLSAPRTS